jgi:hypothetical protein
LLILPWSTLGIGATIRIGREMLCLPYAGFFQHACFFRLSSAFPGLIFINKKVMLMNTKYKIVLHVNGAHLAFSKNITLLFYAQNRENAKKKSLYLKNHNFTLIVFLHAHL